MREEQLSNLQEVETHLTIDRRTLKATLRKRGKTIWSSRVGVGAPATVTPKGSFWVRERLRNLGGSPVYGPWAFGTSAYSDDADGLAGRRRRRDPRHQPAGADPRPPVARLRPRAEREDRAGSRS